jgi:hypothetical protein
MAAYSGKFKYLESGGRALQEGACRLALAEESLALTPAKGAPLVCDLADIDVFAPGDYELSLRLYTGRTILLTHFAKDFQNLCHDLLEAWRTRLIQCLLLEDLEEIARYDGQAQLHSAESAFSSHAEIRLFKSNLAVVPESGNGFSWRLADLDSVDFDEASYTLDLRSGADRLVLTRLAKRTREFIDKLQEAMADISEKSASTLHDVFPFLSPDQLQRTAELMKEGRAAPVSSLNGIHPKTEDALVCHAVDASLRPYFDALKAQTSDQGYFAGFKFVRPEPDAGGAEDDDAMAQELGVPAEEQNPANRENGAAQDEVENREDAEHPVLHWFFFPLKSSRALVPANVVAWEASSRGGRATYFFRLLPPEQATQLQDKGQAAKAIHESIRQLNRAIVLLNFRREPIYLPDDSLDTQPRFHRHAIAQRKIPALRQLRASFLGRALHTSLAAWQKQVQSILARA